MTQFQVSPAVRIAPSHVVERNSIIVETEVQQSILLHRMRAAREEPEYLVVRIADAQNASAVWMIVSFFVAYISLPLIGEATGLMEGLLSGLWPAIPAFGAMLLATFVGIGIFKPEIRLPKPGAKIPDAIGPAIIGYFSTWALLHNTVPGLRSWWDFGGPELLFFVALNAIEAVLFGAMLGSFTRDRVKGLALGAVFQAAFAYLWCLMAL
ncbi:MAG: hypothetical protein ACI9VR_000130 [Cognaticolwellia sp.]